MVRRGMTRGLEREKVNSDFMRLRNYTVVDNPALESSDGLDSIKEPDHRINGKIFDSYAPKMKVTVTSWSWEWDGAGNPLSEICLDELSPLAQKHFRYFEGEFILKEIKHKVKEGMCETLVPDAVSTFPPTKKICSQVLVEIGWFH